ncbi:hypothetical protein [Mesomycoplasma ovipneumoniae]
MNKLIRKNTKIKAGIQSVNYLSKITYLTLQNASKMTKAGKKLPHN